MSEKKTVKNTVTRKKPLPKQISDTGTDASEKGSMSAMTHESLI